MRVGVAGLGRMGTAIAERLKEVGHDLVVWNRSPEKTKPLADAGAEVAKSPAELASRAEAIVTILTDAEAIDTVYRGRSGILAGGIAGTLVIDMSTVQPETEVRLAEEARAKGAAFVECPVGGAPSARRAPASSSALRAARRRMSPAPGRSSSSSAAASSMSARSAPARA